MKKPSHLEYIAESLKRNNLTRNDLIIEERTQINSHKPRYFGTIKYSL